MKSYVNDFNTTVQTYYKDLKKCKPFSREKEKDLLIKAKKNNLWAKNAILTSNLRFVFNIANQYKGYGIAMEDLISEGNLGLTKAIERFDITKNVKFISYAVWWVRQSMQEFIKNKQKIDNIEISTIENNTDKSNCDEDEIVADKHDIIDDESDYEKEENKDKIIKELLLKLNDRGRFIIESYYGLNGRNEQTLEEIGNELGISKERVRQIKEKNLRILRTELMLLDNFENIFK